MEKIAQSVRENSRGWMIQVLSARLDRSMEKRLQPLNLNIRQFGVMMTILEKGGLTQNKIGERFSMPAHAISRALDHLESLGYVKRLAHETSRRAFRVHATKSGEKLAPKLFAIVTEVNAELLQPLTDNENNAFGEMLAKLVQAEQPD